MFNELLIKNRTATYFMEVDTSEWQEIRIFSADIFFEFNHNKVYNNLRAAIDRLNKQYGKQTVFYGSVKGSQICKSNTSQFCPCFTNS